jgi:two-component system response regulator PilR (NtrC family)
MKKSMALVVMSPERRRSLQHSLELLDLRVLPAGSCQEARILLKDHPPVSVVITDVSLIDGNWCDVFRFLVDHDVHASVVVSSRLADERLWSEVLWRGAYDVLVEPYEMDEVRRIVEGALRAVASRPNGKQATAAASMH